MEKHNNSSIVEKAREFAQVLASSQDFIEFYSSQEKFKQDKDAQSILNKFQKKQQEIQKARMGGRGFFTGKAYNEIEELDHKLRSNSTIIALTVAQQKVIDLIQYTNQIISDAVGFDFGQGSSGGCSC